MSTSGPGERRQRVRGLVMTLSLLTVGIAGPLAYALAQPAYSTGDEMVHVDYAYQIWLGQLPNFFDGLELRTDVGYRPDLQWVSQHPPLFYAMLSPIVGPFVEAGRPVVAVMLARGALVLLAGLSVLAVRWAARGAFPSAPHLASTAALIYALASWFPRQGGAIYNDLPAVLAITIASGFLFRALRSPQDRRMLAGLAVSLALASLVRFSTLPLAFVLMMVLLFHRAVVLRRPGRSVLEAASVGAVVLLASGWWWWRNLMVTGNLQGSRADYWIEERGWARRSLTDVVTSDFWQVMLQQFFSVSFMRPSEPWERPAWWGIWLLLFLPVAIGLTSMLADRWARRREESMTELLVAGTLVGLVATVVATQIYYSMSSGSALPRYFFALIPSVAIVMAYGFVRWKWALLAFALWVAVRLGTVALEVESTIARPLRGAQADLYPSAAWAAYGAVVIGSLVALSLVVSQTRRGLPEAAL